MSVVIVGGHDRMVAQYKKICKSHKIVFTNTVSHQMVKSAVGEAEKSHANIIRCHTSSGSALNEILENIKISQ